MAFLGSFDEAFKHLRPFWNWWTYKLCALYIVRQKLTALIPKQIQYSRNTNTCGLFFYNFKPYCV